ncbi:MAG: 1-deoxy-D-xylulose-5-phosphate reductoisomerase, partial [Thermodesulfobacteriota bacterium]
LDVPADRFAGLCPKDALAHPTWQMGEKISIDSATLMNKGLEVIEAKHLFGVATDRIEVVVHAQSIVHSMVAFCDGTVMAQMGVPDMKGAIAYALSHPGRMPLGLPVPDFTDIGALTFQAPDREKFACLALAYEAGNMGGTMPAVLNAANEIAVSAFLNRTLGFDRIPRLIGDTMGRHTPVMRPDIETILEADQWARHTAQSLISEAAAGGVCP